jgi:hypothetical protein
MVAHVKADAGGHGVARLIYSRPIRALTDDVRARIRPVSFLEAKRRASVIKRTIGNSANALNVVPFPIMRRAARAGGGQHRVG